MKSNDGDIKDIYHRVKNHMAVMNSLVRLKSSHRDPGPERHAMEEVGCFLSAVTLVYQLLFNNRQESGISAGFYLRELIDSFGIFSSREVPDIKLSFPEDPLFISPDKAVPLGLLICELIINGIKHAFHDSYQDRVIQLSLTSGSSGWNLVYQDNGRGIPQKINPDENSSGGVGFLLLESLCSQLDGERFPSSPGEEEGKLPGTVMKFIFPADLMTVNS